MPKPNLSGKNVKTDVTQINPPGITTAQPKTIKPKLSKIPSTTHPKQKNTIDSVAP